MQIKTESQHIFLNGKGHAIHRKRFRERKKGQENIHFSLMANALTGEMAGSTVSYTFSTLTFKKFGQLLVRESSYARLYSEPCCSLFLVEAMLFLLICHCYKESGLFQKMFFFGGESVKCVCLCMCTCPKYS